MTRGVQTAVLQMRPTDQRCVWICDEAGGGRACSAGRAAECIECKARISRKPMITDRVRVGLRYEDGRGNDSI